MKRNICMLLAVILCLVALFPVTASAKTYTLSDTDMQISIDDTYWYVFTRDNIKDNPELGEIGVSYDTMYSFLYDNMAYVDAILFYEDGDYLEMFVRKNAVDAGVVNLSNYKKKDVLELAEELAKLAGAENYYVHESQYKFVRIEYFDSDISYYVCEYVTIVNKDNYTLTFQSATPFTQRDYDEMKRIVDSVVFDIDPTLKEPETTTFSDRLIGRVIGGAVIGGIGGAVVAIHNKKKKDRENAEAASVNTPELP